MTPEQRTSHQILEHLRGLSPEHVAPLVDAWHTAVHHPHIAGVFTPQEQMDRLGRVLARDVRARVPYALALEAAGLVDPPRVHEAMQQGLVAGAAAMHVPWWVRLPLPIAVRIWLNRRNLREQHEDLRGAIRELCPAGFTHPQDTGCTGCSGPEDL